MNIIALLVWINLHFALSSKDFQEADRLVTWRLRNIVSKYKVLAIGNAEFSRWIEKINNVAAQSSFEARIMAESDFKGYDKTRQMLEDEITERLTTLRSLIFQKEGGRRCVKHYQHQENELRNAYKSSNERKKEVIFQNGKKCPTKGRRRRKENDYYDYYY
ncbi:uncharacterized protein LOC6548828 [Drosophila erecta]|uniref:Uncharacterized protein n=1 Tax=Drosophila erecta TaxID=7220 RepID=B3NM02_DROER|nr:uncharacterized protein LOC6548828 [Drosophila erecta]EDV54538.1 uncharacterized protein Dere_GG21241 [Drosophila erecta]